MGNFYWHLATFYWSHWSIVTSSFNEVTAVVNEVSMDPNNFWFSYVLCSTATQTDIQSSLFSLGILERSLATKQWPKSNKRNVVTRKYLLPCAALPWCLPQLLQASQFCHSQAEKWRRILFLCFAHLLSFYNPPPHTHLMLTLVNDFIGNATQCDKKTSPNVYKTCLKIISQEKW